MIPCPEPEAALIGRVVAAVARPGTWLSGEERVAVAAAARNAADGAPMPGVVSVASVAHTVSVAATTIRGEWVSSLPSQGIDLGAYAETIGVVGRLWAVDTFCFAMGLDRPALPAPSPGEPSQQTEPMAAPNGGWIPTVGPAGAANSLSSVPQEHNALHDVLAAFYLSGAGMLDPDADRGLHRTQMELVASRTSWLNDCFY
jgi:hypothetical protein